MANMNRMPTQTTPTNASMVLVMGETGAGKSYFVKALAPDNESVVIGHSMKSCSSAAPRTQFISAFLTAGTGTQISMGVHSMVGSKEVYLVDTPGFNDTVRSNGDIILEISKGLLAQKALGMKLMGIIYLHDITQYKWTGALKRQLKIVKLIAGQENFKHILLVTTKWGDGARKDEFEDRQAELEDDYWEDLVEKGARVLKFEGTAESAKGIVSQLNVNVDVELALQHQMAMGPHVHLNDTEVGKYALREREKDERLYKNLMKSPDESREDFEELKTSLAVSANDQKKLQVEMYDKIEEMIQRKIEEEMRRTRNRPSTVNVISWILSAVGAVFTGINAFL
jgi:hypothetical protein